MTKLEKICLVGVLGFATVSCGGSTSDDGSISAEDGADLAEDDAPDETPIATDPAEEVPVETDPVEEAPVEEAPVATEPVEETPVETDPVGTEPAEDDGVEPRDVDAFELRLGDCFDAEVQDEVQSLPVVSCDVEHTGEVFHLFDLPEGDGEFPGGDAVDAGAQEGCLGEFDAYVGLDFASSRWDVGYLFPTEQTWNVLDDREVVCYVADVNGERVTVSAEGSAE